MRYKWGEYPPQANKTFGSVLCFQHHESQTFPTYYNSKITWEFDQSTERFFLFRDKTSGGLTSSVDLIVFCLFYCFPLKKLGLDLCKEQIEKYIYLWEFIQRTLIIEDDNITTNMYAENAGVNFLCLFPVFYKSQRLYKRNNSVEVILGSLFYITTQDAV